MKSIFDIPFYLLKHIISFRNELDLLDLICFSLTCKNLYNNRNKYLRFDSEDYDISSSSFQSFKSLFEQQSKQSTGLKLIVNNKRSKKEDLIDYLYDYIEDIETFDFENSKLLNIVDRILVSGNSSQSSTLPDLSKFSNLKSLIIENKNKQHYLVVDISKLPSTITDLQIGPGHVTVLGTIPHGITKLYYKVRQTLEEPFKHGFLPSTLEELRLKFEFPLEEGMLPSNLKSFHLLTQRYKHSLEHLPKSLESISFHNSNTLTDQSITEHFLQLTNLKRVYNFNYELVKYLPKQVEYLSLSMHNCIGRKTIDFSSTSESTPLPESVTSLDFANMFNYNLQPKSLPNTITSLALRGYRGCPTPQIFPKYLKMLELDDVTIDYIPNLFPKTLEYLKLGSFFRFILPTNQYIEMIANLGSLHLEISQSFIRNIDFPMLPSNVQSVVIDCLYSSRRIDNDTFIFYDQELGSGGFIKSNRINEYFLSK